MTPMIEATGVVKRFGKTVALDGLELFSEQGVILAVLGPNGAGKTTFVRCLATLIKPDAGTVRVFGYDVARSRTPSGPPSASPVSSPPSNRR